MIEAKSQCPRDATRLTVIMPADAMSCGNVGLYFARRSLVLSLLGLRNSVYRGNEDVVDIAIGLGKWLLTANL